MATETKIQWTHHTFNPWRGCSKVSAGCANCYAETLSARNPKTLGIWGANGTRAIAAESYWRQPLKWHREAMDAGERRRVFCASLADVFEGPDTMPKDAVEPVSLARTRLFDLIDATEHLDWLLLTKRPENIRKMWKGGHFRGRPVGPVIHRSNVWLLTSIEDQATADQRIPELLKCRELVPVLGISAEPLLEGVELPLRTCSYCGQGVIDTRNRPAHACAHCGRQGPAMRGLDWVIVGGESGPHARPFYVDWADSLREQCHAAGVAFFMKQMGAKVRCEENDEFGDTEIRLKDSKGGDPAEWPDDLRVREFPATALRPVPVPG